VRYELAFARFRSGRYASATELLKPLAADPNLPGAESFASRLLLVESLVHQGEIDHARRIFDLLEPAGASAHAESQLDALSGLLARAALFPSTADLARRDWHFIEHAGVLLLEARARESALPTGTLGPESLAAILLRLAALLRSLDLEPREIQHLTPRTRPLAVALARMMGASCSTFQQNTEHRTLVVLHEPGEAEPFLCDLRNHEEGVHLFALYADPRRRYALHPEIVGLFGGELELPWTAPAEAAAQSVVAALPALDQDAAELDSLCRYYAPLRELLVLGHPDRHPVRRVLTPLRRHPGPDAP
jgi:hypothetical protein